MAEGQSNLEARVERLEKELQAVYSMLEMLQDAMGAEDFAAAYEALSFDAPVDWDEITD